MFRNTAAIILAGGKGSRMNSELPKVLHEVGGKQLILRNIEKLKSVGLQDFYIVVGYKAQEVEEVVSSEHEVVFATQEEPLGTNHALETALDLINPCWFENIFVINGDDAALYKDETLKAYIQSHIDSKAVISIMTLELEGEHELGKIVRDEKGNFENTLEKFEYKDMDLDSKEINCGVYIYNTKWVCENVKKVKQNGKREYPITDLMKLAKEQGKAVHLYKLADRNEWAGVNTPEELEAVNKLVKESSL